MLTHDSHWCTVALAPVLNLWLGKLRSYTGCGEALTVGFCPGCAELTAWTAAARTHQNACCTSCSAAFHVAKCPGCAEVAAYVGTHAAAQFSASSTGSPHARSKEPGSATAAAQCSGLTCENCSLHFFECGCPACGKQASIQQLRSFAGECACNPVTIVDGSFAVRIRVTGVWGAHPARVLTALMGCGGKKGGPELECEACTYRFRCVWGHQISNSDPFLTFCKWLYTSPRDYMPKVDCRSADLQDADCCRYKPDRHVSRGGGVAGAPDPFSSSSSDDARRSGGVGSDGDGSCSDTETESDEDTDWVTPQVSLYLPQHARQANDSDNHVHLSGAQEWRSWRAPREQRWDNAETHSGGTVLGAGVGGAGGKQRTGKQSGAYGAGGSGTIRRPGPAPTASAVLAASARHLSKGAKASLHLD